MELKTQEKKETTWEDFSIGLLIVVAYALYFYAWFTWPWVMLAIHAGVLVFIVIPLIIISAIINAIES